jgi:methionine synthase I (cobalamin-dependent)
MDDAAWWSGARYAPRDHARGQEDYVKAGAEVIITNTFPTSRYVLEPAGLGDRFRELNTLAVELAKQAREHTMERQVHIAGSIFTFPARHDNALQPPEVQARAN